MSTEASNAEANFNDYPERCERCPARGQQRVVKGAQSFTFCNHHYNKHEAALYSQGWINMAKVEESVESQETVLI